MGAVLHGRERVPRATTIATDRRRRSKRTAFDRDGVAVFWTARGVLWREDGLEARPQLNKARPRRPGLPASQKGEGGGAGPCGGTEPIVREHATVERFWPIRC
jgi:hypothetical protein